MNEDPPRRLPPNPDPMADEARQQATAVVRAAARIEQLLAQIRELLRSILDELRTP